MKVFLFLLSIFFGIFELYKFQFLSNENIYLQSSEFNGKEVLSGTEIIEHSGFYEIIQPNSNKSEIFSLTEDFEKRVLLGEDPPKQWIAWYGKGCIGCTDGFTYMSTDFVVPPVPTGKSNLAIFNGLQASYNPTQYNWILQPVLRRGLWMDGYTEGWALIACMCPNFGTDCLYTKPIPTTPGNSIRGVMKRLNSGAPYNFEISITDLTAGSPTQTLKISTKYFAQWAFVTLEHNPVGNIQDCSELPDADSLSFTNMQLTPKSTDFWQGSQYDMSCGVSVENFVMQDQTLTIKLR